MCNSDTSSHGAAPGNTQASVQGSAEAYASWTHGGALVGTFMAERESESFTVTFRSGNAFFNAIQIREVATGGAVVSDPKIGSAAVAVSRRKATVELAGIAMGTDVYAEPATSYRISYRLSRDGGNPKEVIMTEDRTEPAATFDMDGARDLAGHPRVFDAGPDIGCFEKFGAPPPF